jgi:membrane fusion protein, multidrug efflux system
VPGKMVARSAEVGQRVKAGQVLAQLDAADLRLGQDTAAAAIRAAQANFDVVAGEHKRYRELRDQGFISALELERRSSALQAAQSQLDQARAQGQVQGNQAAYAALTAPGAGVVVGVDAEPGAVLAVGASVVRLALDGPRDAVFTVPEDSLVAMRALQGKPGALQVRAWGTQALLPATVREVAAAADPVTRTFLVKADLGATALQLGQTLTAIIQLPRQSGVTRLPLSAVMNHQGQSAVWLLDRTSMTVKAQPVQIAGADGNFLVVSSGLAAGQTVVTAGVHVLTQGQKVKLFEAVASAKP